MKRLSRPGLMAPRCLKNVLLTAFLFIPLMVYFGLPLPGNFYSLTSFNVHYTVLNYVDEESFNASIPTKGASMPLSTSVPAKKKTILFWTPFYKTQTYWELLFHDTVSGDCPLSNCRLTQDHRLLPKADAVVFHLLDIQLNDLPKWRAPGQIWVLFSLESPAYPLVRQVDLSRLNGLFNWTMTYRWDSDVPVPYGLVLPRDPLSGTVRHLHLPGTVRRVLPRRPTLERSSHPRRKMRLVAWMVSNCHTPGGREQYVSELRKHIQVSGWR